MRAERGDPCGREARRVQGIGRPSWRCDTLSVVWERGAVRGARSRPSCLGRSSWWSYGGGWRSRRRPRCVCVCVFGCSDMVLLRRPMGCADRMGSGDSGLQRHLPIIVMLTCLSGAQLWSNSCGAKGLLGSFCFEAFCSGARIGTFGDCALRARVSWPLDRRITRFYADTSSHLRAARRRVAAALRSCARLRPDPQLRRPRRTSRARSVEQA